jgi:hypothetical protein
LFIGGIAWLMPTAGRLALELQRDLVPAAAFATAASRDFFSARIGVYHPVWGMDLATLCAELTQNTPA